MDYRIRIIGCERPEFAQFVPARADGGYARLLHIVAVVFSW
jgi:hypothetical protein